MKLADLPSVSIALVAFFIASACGGSPAGPEADAVSDPQLSATVTTFIHEVRVPFSNSQFWACSNEVVDFDGWFNVTVRETISNSGNTTFRVHVISHVEGVGQTTGDEYVSNETTNLTLHSGDVGSVITLQFRINRISKGSSPNSFGWITLHLTFNANGELTAIVDEAEFDVCRG